MTSTKFNPINFKIAVKISKIVKISLVFSKKLILTLTQVNQMAIFLQTFNNFFNISLSLRTFLSDFLIYFDMHIITNINLTKV